MKILHTVEFYSPSVGGAQEVVKQLSEHLVLLGHDVTVATTKLTNRSRKSINGVKIIGFDINGNAVRGYNGEDVENYKKYLINGGFDVIMNYAAQQWTADLAFEVIDQIKARKVFVPCGFSGLYDPSYSEYFKAMPALLRKYDQTVYLSHDYRDINFAKVHKINNRIVIPNGADEREFRKSFQKDINQFRYKLGIPDKNRVILSVGSHTGLKGHSETIEAFKNANLSESTLLIIGNEVEHGGCKYSCKLRSQIFNFNQSLFKKKSNSQVLVKNLSRGETIIAFQAAYLFLFLSNIECSPLVLFEAAASGTPFIASMAGNSSEIANWTKSGLTIESKVDKSGYTTANIGDAVHAIKKLFDDLPLYERMSKSGRKAWEAKYTWEKIAKEYEKIYEKN